MALITEFASPTGDYAQPTLVGYIDLKDNGGVDVARLITEAIFQGATVRTAEWSESRTKSVKIEATRFQWNVILRGEGLALDDEQISDGLWIVRDDPDADHVDA